MDSGKNAASGTPFRTKDDRHAALMDELSRTAQDHGWLVKERQGREGPVRPDGRRWRYLAGPLGGEPTEGFDTLPPLARWVEKMASIA
ncbi:hypothetical protein WV31_10320 [Magnetospirillum sp. ME-1]|uniref:hypothetical protein n=1 Tax=Magnetospirillum sp. ME-1 TaxID=1639348 RepID=UPI000A17D7EF|nr:hypothetical protein [Magnetospirillum sp. ME-1]ARJ66021.1 hypothetical protein WV31_10320 [Magnetospirillum sp. ME-1]